jgi:nucleoid-associated protein EbfC
MRNIGNLLKQAQAVQENMAKAQAELAQVTVTGESGGGMVKLQMNGKHEVARVQIEAGVALDDREMLEDLLAAAINDAVRKVEVAVQTKMQGVMGGLQLPPGMKLPF